MRLRTTAAGVIAFDQERDRWVSLPAALAARGEADGPLVEASRDLLVFLSGGAPVREAALALLESVHTDQAVRADPDAAGLPFQARSMRAFMVFESHVVNSARVLVKRFFPPPAAAAMTAFERVTGKTFPPLNPKKRFREVPPMYVGNHTAMLADGQPMWWPSHTTHLDFELELACVITKPLVDASPEEARDAIGGWFVLNDWSARDVQALDYRENVFGPVVKAKTFANSMGADVITPDELPDWTTATGRVRVDGEVWCEGNTAGPQWDIGDMLAYASEGECLGPGDIFSTGTMPGCCGLELDRWVTRGQTVELEIDGIGTLTSKIDGAATPWELAPQA